MCMAYSFCCMSWIEVGNSVIVLNGATANWELAQLALSLATLHQLAHCPPSLLLAQIIEFKIKVDDMMAP